MSEYFVGSTGANNQTNFSSLDTSEVLDDLGLNTGDSPTFSGLFLEGSGSTIFSVDGSNGRLFGVTDEVTGTVFSVNDAAGLPIIEVESTSSYDKITLGEYGSDLLVLSGQNTIEITGSQIASQSWVGQQGFITSETDDQNLNQVLAEGNSSSYGISVNQITGTALTIDTDTLFVDSTNDRVGIGTTSPSQKLHIASSSATNLISKLEQDNADYQAWYEANCQDGGFARFGIADNADNFAFWNTDQGSYRWFVASEKMRLTSDGNLGIGTTSPAEKLEVNGSIKVGPIKIQNSPAGRIGFNRNTADGAIYDSNYGAAQLQNNAAGQFEIQSYNSSGTYTGSLAIQLADGNVGIGTTSPAQRLHVSGGHILLDNNKQIRFKDSGATERTIIQLNSSNDLAIGGSYAGALTFMGGGSYTEQMRIHDNGNVGIGTTSPARKLHVSTGNTDVAARFENTSSNGTVIEVVTSGDSKTLQIQTDHILANAALHLGSDSYNTYIRGANVGIGTTTPNVSLEVHGADITSSSNTTAASVLRLVRDITDSSYTLRKDSAVDFMLSRQQASANNLPYTRLDIRLAGTTDSSTPSLDVMSLLHNGNVGIGTTSPATRLDVYKSTSTSGGSTGTPLLRLHNYVGSDLAQQKTFIDFTLTDDNGNETPQVRIGAEVGQNGDANTQEKEGSGAFVVYTNNADTVSGDAGASLAERMRVDYQGNVGIGTTTPAAKLQVYSTATSNIFISGHGTSAQNNWAGEHAFFVNAGNGIIVGKANANNDTNRLYTFYNDAQGNAEQYIYNTSNVATIKLDSAGDTYFNGGNVGIGDTTPSYKLDVAGDIRATGDLRADDDVFIAGDVLRFTNDAASAYIQSADALILEADYDADDTGGKPITFKTAGTTKMTIAGGGDVTINNGLIVSGDLTVNGTTSTINSTTVQVDDKNIELGTVATPTDTTADGGGITLKGTTDKTINWLNSTGAWTFSEKVSVTADESVFGGSGGIPLYVRSTGTVSYVQIQNSSTGGSGTNDGLTVGCNGTAGYLWLREAANLNIGTNDTTAITISSSQNTTFAGNIHLDDDSSQLQFGDDNDMQIYHNGANGEINNSTGGFTIDSAADITLDSAADITLDAGGQDIILSDDGTIFGTLSNSSGLQIRSRVNNADMYLRGVDGGTEFTALRLDMSAGGVATFSSNVIVNGGQILTPSGTNLALNPNTGIVSVGGVIQCSGTGASTFAGDLSADNITSTSNGGSASVYINSTRPTLGFTDSNSFTDTNDIYIVRAGVNDLKFQWYDDTASSTTDTFSIDNSGNATFAGSVTLAGPSNEIIKSNGSIRLNIDSNADQSDRIFIVSTGANSELFRVDESGHGTFANSVTATSLDINGAATFDTNVNSGGFNTQTNSNAGSAAYVSRKWVNDTGYAEIWRNSSTRTQTGQAAQSFNIFNTQDTNLWSGGARALHLDTSQNATFAGNITATNLTLSSLNAQNSEATVLVINGSSVVGTRELGANAFNSTTIPSAYSHHTQSAISVSEDLTGADVIDAIDITVNTEGHVTAASATSRTLTLGDLGYTGATNANNYSLPEATATVRGGIELFSNTDQSVAANSVSSTSGRTYGIQLNSAGQAVVNVPWSDNNTVYTHPTHAGDDIDIDTGALTGATVISDLDFNITTNTSGHVTDANGTVATRTLTAANLGISAPNAPASASAAIVGNTVEVTFAESTTSNIDSYLIYSSIDGSDYGLISIVPPADFAASMSIIDNAFDETGTQAYRVYAMKYGILSSAATDSVSYSVSSAEPTTMSVVNLNNAYYVQWNPPSSNARFVTAYNVYKHEHATQGSLSRGSASLIYSGMNTNYMYQISGTNNSNFHQFWVETTIA